MLDRSLAEKRVTELLTGFPPRVVEAYLAFATSGDHAQLDIVVLGVLYFYLAKKPATRLEDLPGSTRLIEDLGCDSLTMMDMVFMVEGLFDAKIDDTELAKIATLDDLRAHLRAHLQAPGAPIA